MKHKVSLAVRHYECDSYGHVNHAVYVNYLEHARMQYLQAAGFDYAGLIADGFLTIISKLTIAYRAPAFAGDELQIESEPAETRRIRGVFRQRILRGAVLLAEAEVHWCVVDRNGRPARPPEKYDLRRIP